MDFSQTAYRPAIGNGSNDRNISTETPEASDTCKVLGAAKVAEHLLREVNQGLQALGVKPRLVGFLANGDDGAKQYAQYSAKTCMEK